MIEYFTSWFYWGPASVCLLYWFFKSADPLFLVMALIPGINIAGAVTLPATLGMEFNWTVPDHYRKGVLTGGWPWERQRDIETQVAKAAEADAWRKAFWERQIPQEEIQSRDFDNVYYLANRINLH